ncbi:carbohydrate porin [Actimicrobium sp. CCI2.3]|uniref:carbohydrate porin n=1 Tax=Actimicrobium sp. CCI2.3 TaxID=3048616 RepID=UPI002AB3E093|nr:carbohydrate porin [Actimicrobium sp. CCI2.3]MDY7575113.1 carbohydrate porin [Actimicrobium sp. CCI2.3]MEB0022546.1 carbohydrate porin [Actimicrobium sp. CCI2.3]
MIATHHSTTCFKQALLSPATIVLLALASVFLLETSSSTALAANEEPRKNQAAPTITAPESPFSDAAAAPENWAVHGQVTNVTQRHPHFASTYSGTNSLIANGRTEETTDLTLYAGIKLWRGAEFWINPEIDQGFGLSNTVGMAGFPSGEAYKVGANTPYLRLPRAFLRQVIPLAGAQVPVEATANQLGGTRAANNVTLTAGKLSVTDIFDTNRYAHDPRSDFLNWSVIDAGAFDYAADAWGFTYGAAAEWTQDAWTLRGGAFQLSKVPNGKIVAVDFSQYMLVTELEQRYQLSGHDGKVKLLGFVNRGRMGSYHDAVERALLANETPDTAVVRRWSYRPGAAINIEQELAADLGLFARASVNNGTKEAYEFTEINRSISAGLAWKGNQWGRHDDTFGVAVAINGLSSDARRYFAAGGIGILIGDGRQTYGTEKILETYYAMRVTSHMTLSVNYQRVNNPAYNRDRGPVSLFGVRTHAEF